jgi:serine-type D-Ala-D-Ala carboxypeptidase/endopeptidase (penicillin-binding protein 4)
MSRHRGSSALVALVWLVPAAAFGLRDELAQAAEQARRVAPALGIHVVDVATGETVYAYAEDEPRILASNTKLLTAAAAVDLLTPGYYLDTALRARGLVVDGELLGDLAVVGAGDPTISGRLYGDDPLYIFRQWGERLRAVGIDRVGGDLVLADGGFEALQVHPDWPRDQLHKWYEAPVSSLSFNDNCVWVVVRPGTIPGDPAQVEILPRISTLGISNQAKTTSKARSQSLVVDRRPGSDVIEVSGWIYQRGDPYVVAVTVPDPERLFGRALLAGLTEAGVVVAGEPRIVDRLPADEWRVLAEHRTDLSTVLEVLNKRSQNFYAESLVKLLGLELCGKGSWETGGEAVAAFLERAGIARGTYSWADGSGMSRNNRFSARQMTTLLRYMYFHPDGRVFLRSLAYSGESELDPPWMTSSLSHRFTEDAYRGNVLAKTGGLDGVSTLSGYVKAQSGKIYAFSILCNSTPARWRAIEAQDRIVRVLVDRG